MKNFFWKAVATACGIGFVPLAPGTAASLAVSLIYKFFFFRLPLGLYLVMLALVLVSGVIASAVQASELREGDPRRVVIDEVGGQLIALTSLPPTWTAVGLSFLFFLFLDIVKPFPVRKTEKLPRGWGIMADDALAGLMTRLLLLAVLLIWAKLK